MQEGGNIDIRHGVPTRGRFRPAFGLGALFAVLAAIAWLLPPIAQPLEYHRFADQSTCLGVPHCYDSLSNLLFMLAGVAGLVFLASGAGARSFIDPRERMPYALFFLATVLVGFGSGYYHLAPDNSRLVWDRAAIAVALMAWFAAIIGERVDLAWGRRLLPLLVVAGLGSTWYWGWSEQIGQGDLRPYLLMELVPILFVPLLLWLYPPRYSRDRDIVIVLCLYPLALVCDFLDRPIAGVLGFVSGHSLKHIIAAGAAAWVLIGLHRRRPLKSTA